MCCLVFLSLGFLVFVVSVLCCIFVFLTAELPPNVKKKKSASFKYKSTKVPQPIKMVVRITLLVRFLKQLSEFYFLSN